MLSPYNFFIFNLIKIFNIPNRRLVLRIQLKHLVKVTIIDLTIITYGDEIKAHHVGSSRGIKGIDQSLLIFFKLSTSFKIFEKSFNWHIGNGVKIIKLNIKPLFKVSFIIFFKFFLRWRKHSRQRM